MTSTYLYQWYFLTNGNGMYIEWRSSRIVIFCCRLLNGWLNLVLSLFNESMWETYQAGWSPTNRETCMLSEIVCFFFFWVPQTCCWMFTWVLHNTMKFLRRGQTFDESSIDLIYVLLHGTDCWMLLGFLMTWWSSWGDVKHVISWGICELAHDLFSFHLLVADVSISPCRLVSITAVADSFSFLYQSYNRLFLLCF